jgi:hypothetical protein
VVSTLCQTIIWPAGMVAGFGENDCDPLTATTLMVTAVPGIVAGLLGPEGEPAVPHPPIVRLRTAAARPGE